MKEKIIEIFTDLQDFISLSAIEQYLGLPDKSLRRAWKKNDLPPEVINHFIGLVQKWTNNADVQKQTSDSVQIRTKDAIILEQAARIVSLEEDLAKKPPSVPVFKSVDEAIKSVTPSDLIGKPKLADVLKGTISKKPPYSPHTQVKKGFSAKPNPNP